MHCPQKVRHFLGAFFYGNIKIQFRLQETLCRNNQARLSFFQIRGTRDGIGRNDGSQMGKIL